MREKLGNLAKSVVLNARVDDKVGRKRYFCEEKVEEKIAGKKFLMGIITVNEHFSAEKKDELGSGVGGVGE